MTTFKTEAQFEQAFIELLHHKGWGKYPVLKFKTEAELLQNWADILLENNKQRGRLNDIPLTSGEMQQILEQIKALKTPLKLNGFINGKTVAIKRDNPADTERFGKEISLKIFDPKEAAAGQSRYQIVQQPKFERGSPLRNDRRGDVLLLINGMPVIHVELKRSGVPVSQAVNQIEKYSKEGIFSGLFSLIQVFVAMEPNETKYFANPGMDGKFNPDYQFNWADFNNEPIHHWNAITDRLLNAHMAHELIGLYTVADDTDGVLKVMRSYQYYAANAISDKVAKTTWQPMGNSSNLSSNNKDRLGGYIWHTTGSGKTMTSFKSAQLIAQSNDADKVIFLMDRIELGTQSLAEYNNFAGDSEEVQATENTHVLITKLKSTDRAQTLIVTSIQKMSNIVEAVIAETADDEGTATAIPTNMSDIQMIRAKRLVFIIDEAHRSTMSSGSDNKEGMLIAIKKTYPTALFFGFTGTPIQDENQVNKNTTADVFGNELHRYSIADGIRDGNVLGFDPYKVPTFRDSDIKQAVALAQAKADSVTDAMADPAKKKKFNYFMNDVPMAGSKGATGRYTKGIEDYVPKSQYLTDTHQEKVVADIIDKWDVLSQGNKFHAIFATNSIAEAIDYYRRLKAAKPELKISALFDPNIDNDGGSSNRGPAFKGDGLEEIMSDYNARYGQDFDFARHSAFKKDIAARLAHKQPYERIATDSTKQLDLLIVVDQMLTGFDSKWLNTLYLDKVIRYQNIIQAFSRTNRLFGPDKPHGIIRYYRYPHTMEQHIEDAVKLYSGDRPIGLFVDKLESNLEAMNDLVADITELFVNADVGNFEKLPEDDAACAKFADLFKTFNQHLAAAKVQGLHWDNLTHSCGENDDVHDVTLAIDEQDFLGLALRYKELIGKGEGSGGGGGDVPFDIVGYLTEIPTGKVNADYMNSNFDKFLKELNKHQDQASIELTLNELHKSFASLTQIEQKYAKLFLHELQRGDAQLIDGHSFRDYINDYKDNAENAQINAVVNALGLDKNKLMALMADKVDETNLNNFGRFDALKETVNKEQAKAYFEKNDDTVIPAFKLNMRIAQFLKQFIFAQADSEFMHELDDVIDDTKSAIPIPLVFGDKKLYQASQISKLNNTQELGAITLKTDLPYEDNPASLMSSGHYAELKALGVVSSSVLDTTMVALIELEQITKALDIPLYQEGQSGIIWALNESREGSRIDEYIAYAVQIAGDEAFRTYIESMIYDLGKMTFGAAFITIPSRLMAKRKEKNKEKLKLTQDEIAEKEQIDHSPNVVDFRANEKLMEKWKQTEH
jgi:type I restriction enzyme R subunit